MTLRDKLGRSRTDLDARRRLVYETFGFLSNPFPPASQPMGHGHLDTAADDAILEKLKQFEDTRTSQAVVIEGTQGTGKTNLLEYYERELEATFCDDGYYIIRYYPDPEPGFEAVLRKIIQAFGDNHFTSLVAAFNAKSSIDQHHALSVVKGHEMRAALVRLMAMPQDTDLQREAIDLFVNWLLGLRVLKRHQELLGVKFRLDTSEAQTQALRDLVYFSSGLGKLNAIFLLLDELEKQDYALSKLVVLRYLSAIRALIDALPQNLFAILAMTPDARLRYFGMLPALAGRLRSVATLTPLKSSQEAMDLYSYYVTEGRARAASDSVTKRWRQGSKDLLARNEVRQLYLDLATASEKIGEEGVKQRVFLDALHNRTNTLLGELG